MHEPLTPRIEPATECAEQCSLSPEERQAVIHHYGIEQVRSWTRNDRGLVNESYELDDRYFLTIHRRKTRDQMEAIAQVVHSMDNSIPITRPLPGLSGYSVRVQSRPALLNPRLPGMHYVGPAHTEKSPIPIELHRSLATFFWQIQQRLSAVSEQLKKRLTSPSVIKIGAMPEQLPAIAESLVRHSPGESAPDFAYPDLIHDDMERQNILSIRDEITGLVDLDSIRTGDILHEFAHFLFNFALCDPQANWSTVDVYMNTMIKAGIIRPKDIPSLHAHVYRFAISDVIDFKGLTVHPQCEQHTMIDLKLLVQQYDRALALASSFFRKEFSL